MDLYVVSTPNNFCLMVAESPEAASKEFMSYGNARPFVQTVNELFEISGEPYTIMVKRRD